MREKRIKDFSKSSKESLNAVNRPRLYLTRISTRDDLHRINPSVHLPKTNRDESGILDYSHHITAHRTKREEQPANLDFSITKPELQVFYVEDRNLRSAEYHEKPSRSNFKSDESVKQSIGNSITNTYLYALLLAVSLIFLSATAMCIIYRRPKKHNLKRSRNFIKQKKLKCAKRAEEICDSTSFAISSNSVTVVSEKKQKRISSKKQIKSGKSSKRGMIFKSDYQPYPVPRASVLPETHTNKDYHVLDNMPCGNTSCNKQDVSDVESNLSNQKPNVAAKKPYSFPKYSVSDVKTILSNQKPNVTAKKSYSLPKCSVINLLTYNGYVSSSPISKLKKLKNQEENLMKVIPSSLSQDRNREKKTESKLERYRYELDASEFRSVSRWKVGITPFNTNVSLKAAKKIISAS